MKFPRIGFQKELKQENLKSPALLQELQQRNGEQEEKLKSAAL